MKLVFLILTILFCLAFVGPKNQINSSHAKSNQGQVWDADNAERDAREKSLSQTLALVSDFISVPERFSFIVQDSYEYVSPIQFCVSHKVLSRGPPAV